MLSPHRLSPPSLLEQSASSYWFLHQCLQSTNLKSLSHFLRLERLVSFWSLRFFHAFDFSTSSLPPFVTYTFSGFASLLCNIFTRLEELTSAFFAQSLTRWVTQRTKGLLEFSENSKIDEAYWREASVRKLPVCTGGVEPDILILGKLCHSDFEKRENLQFSAALNVKTHLYQMRIALLFHN